MELQSIEINRRIEAFDFLSKEINLFLNGGKNKILEEAFAKSTTENKWFTEEFVAIALRNILKTFYRENIEVWASNYDLLHTHLSKKKVAVIMAGNIPLVGFFDFFYVLISGNIFYGKLSSRDKFLLPALAEILCSKEPLFKNYISFFEYRPENFDIVIATGSNNSSRYFEYYFGKYPNIIRKNRKSIAVLTGNESDEDLEKLADDVFLYFGLGCRNVSKLFIPEKYDFSSLINTFQKYSRISTNAKYINNYNYYKTVMYMNNVPFIDGNFFLLSKSEDLASPVSVIYFEEYTDKAKLKERIEGFHENIQVVVSNHNLNIAAIEFGMAQNPNIADYADGVDVVKLLCSGINS